MMQHILKIAILCLLLLLVGVKSKGHHFPPGLEGTFLSLPTDGYVVEVLLMPSVAEVGKTTGVLISIRKAKTEHYYTGPIAVTVTSESVSGSDSPVMIETFPRADLQGDREGRHIFYEPGRYAMRIEFQPEDKKLSVESTLEATTSTGPNPLYLGLIVTGFIIVVFVVGLLQKIRIKTQNEENSR